MKLHSTQPRSALSFYNFSPCRYYADNMPINLVSLTLRWQKVVFRFAGTMGLNRFETFKLELHRLEALEAYRTSLLIRSG